MEVINKESATTSHKNKKCGNCKNWSYFDWVRGACIRWGNKVNPGDEDWCCGYWEIGEKWKVCSKCGEVKEREGFHKARQNKDGLNGKCKQCRSEYGKEYYKKPEVKQRVLEYRKQYYEENIKKYNTKNKLNKISDGMKICCSCGCRKVFDEFHKNKNTSDGFSCRCKKCTKEYMKQKYLEHHPPKIKVKVRDGYKICTRCNMEKEFNEFYRNKNTSDKCHSRCKKCISEVHNERMNNDVEYRDKVRFCGKATYERMMGDPVRSEKKKIVRRIFSRKPQQIKKRREYQRELRKDPMVRLNRNISRGINYGLRRGNKAGQHWEKLVGFTLADLKRHLEKQFKDGMTWENYGRGGWEVDHISPSSIFNFSKVEHPDFRRCWSLDNLQPLWASENLSKGAKLDKPVQISFALEERK